jgi:Spy/CpxP family protein refolding chaperone
MSVPAPSVLTALRVIALGSYPVLESQLKLTDAQKPQVRDLLTKAEEKFKTLIEAQRKAGRAFVEALTAKIDEARMISLGQAAAKADADLIAEKVRTLNALRALLTDQQNADLNTVLDRAAMMWKMGPGSPPRTPAAAPPAPENAK